MSARLLVFYDPTGRGQPPATEHMPPGTKAAMLDLPDGLEARDIYEVARRLAELLLEQVEP